MTLSFLCFMQKSDTPLRQQQGAIGVFDSGVGGICVLHAVRQALPGEDLIYVADSGFAPYGDKSPDWITQRCIQIIDFLLSLNCKAILIACNTATVVAASFLRQHYAVPIIAIEPAIKPAAKLTRNGIIALMATQRTIESPQLSRLCENYAPNKKILLLPCPGLADRIEQGHLDHADIEHYLQGKLAPALDAHADTLILGCTHYPLVRAQILRVTQGCMQIIEPSHAVAAQVKRRLSETSLHRLSPNQGHTQLWSSSLRTNAELLQYFQLPAQIVLRLPPHLLP